MKSRRDVLENFQNYYDRMFRLWKKPNEKNMKILQEKYGFDPDKFDFDGIPEPYLGNPKDCSAVIVNINPGKRICFNCRMTIESKQYESYRAYAEDFPYRISDDPMENEGKCDIDWWYKRNKWIKRFTDVSKKPFDMELCPWRSKGWPGWSMLDDKSYVHKHLIEPLCEAVRQSDLPFGLGVGKPVYKTLIDNGFATKRIWDKNKHDDIRWPEGKTRTYAIIVKEETVILCTWGGIRNNVPETNFIETEEDIRRIIENEIITKR